MNERFDFSNITVGVITAATLLVAGQAVGQSSGVTGHAPPPSSDGRAPSGPGQSRLPLVDPKVVPPGQSDPSQKAPPGEPGSAPASPGQTGGNVRR
jgi:hypothetical protein